MTSRSRILIAVVVVALALGVPAGAYLKLGTRVGNRTESLRWRQFPIRYYVTDASVAGVSAQQFQAAEAVMFPIAFTRGNIADRSLKADDIAGISDIYGTTTFSRELGSISGRVTKGGRGVQGAHVVAFSPRTGKLVGGFTLTENGNFVIAGLEPGPHVLRAEPLDDGDANSFFDDDFDVDVDFRVAFYDRVVAVPRGGGARDVEIKVTAK
jgi:hypothetical protein